MDASHKIRWLERSDETEIKRIFAAQNLDCILPPMFPQNEEGHMKSRARNVIVRVGAVDSNNRVRMAILGHRTVEAYFLIDRDWATPGERYGAFLELHNYACAVGSQLGYEDVQALIPPAVEKPFGRRLLSLGWGRNLWACYSREL